MFYAVMDIFRDLQGIPCFNEIDMGDIRELWEFGIAIIIVKKAGFKILKGRGRKGRTTGRRGGMTNVISMR